MNYTREIHTDDFIKLFSVPEVNWSTLFVKFYLTFE